MLLTIRRVRSRWPGGVRVAIAAMLLLLPAAAVAAGPSASCEQLAREATVKAIYQDPQVTEDLSRTLVQLKPLSGQTLDQNHHVYGLTHAEPVMEYQFIPKWSKAADGRICMVPDLTIKTGFSTMQVYLAAELKNPCARQIIREHEYEHVAAWKNHLRVGSRMMEASLRASLGTPRYYATLKQADQALRPWVMSAVLPLEQQLEASIDAAQRAIDSPFSYGNVESRLATCPP